MMWDVWCGMWNVRCGMWCVRCVLACSLALPPGVSLVQKRSLEGVPIDFGLISFFMHSLQDFADLMERVEDEGKKRATDPCSISFTCP